MPSRRTSFGDSRDIAHPINAQTRKMIEDAIFDAYNSECDNYTVYGNSDNKIPENNNSNIEDSDVEDSDVEDSDISTDLY